MEPRENKTLPAEMTRDEFINQLPGLVADYDMTPETHERIDDITLLMMVGGTGAGKTSIIKRLGLPYVVSDTTRGIRPHEINGLDYFFRTDYAQLAQEIKDRKFVQVNVYKTGDFYGTRVSAYPELGFAVYSVVAAKVPSFRGMGFKDTITAFVTAPSFEEWMGRLDTDRNQLESRLAEAQESYKFALSDTQTCLVLNDKLDLATRQVMQLLDGKRDAQREARARQAAEQIYRELAFA